MSIAIAIALLALTVIGTPLFAIMGGSALLSFWRAEIDLQAVIIEFYQLSSKPMLQALPMFAFAGCVLGRSRAPERLLRLSNAFLGWLPGGLAVVAVVACAALTALTGASGITIVALGGLLVPALIRDRYGRDFSLGIVTASGSLGLLFPPSLPVILYGVVSNTSIDDLFRAGILPGILLVTVVACYGLWWGWRRELPRQRFTCREVGSAVWAARFELPLPFIVIGGIYSGFFAISEAAVVAAAYALAAEVLLYRDIRVRELGAVARESTVLTGGILIILGMALALTNFMIDADVPGRVFEFARTYMGSRIAFLAMLNVFLLIVGCMIDIYAATVLVVPLILPIALQFDVHPVHLGIVFLANLAIGYITPPVGLNLFIATIRFKEPILKLYWAALPFFALLLIALIIITYVPGLSLLLLGP